MKASIYRKLEKLEVVAGLQGEASPSAILFIPVDPETVTKVMAIVSLQSDGGTWERHKWESEEEFTQRAINESKSRIFFADCQEVVKWERQVLVENQSI